MLEFLINPNVAYVLLVFGFLIAALALFAPGTGILEAAALAALGLAGYAIANLPVNWWAFGILALAVLAFVLALRSPRQRMAWIIGAAVLFVAGSALLFRGEDTLTGVHPLLIALLSPMAVGLAYLLAIKGLEAVQSRPVFNPNEVIHMTGQVSSDIRGQGSVYINGEEWSASADVFIPAGKRVRVLRRHGLILEVEPEEPGKEE